MKHLNKFLILSDGSLVFIKRPNFKYLFNPPINKIDLNNHFIWFKSNYRSQTEISKFIHKFNQKTTNVSFK